MQSQGKTTASLPILMAMVDNSCTVTSNMLHDPHSVFAEPMGPGSGAAMTGLDTHATDLQWFSEMSRAMQKMAWRSWGLVQP